jgi:hypothetical protein
MLTVTITNTTKRLRRLLAERPSIFGLVSSLSKDWILSVMSALAIVILWLPVALFGQSAMIAGDRYWWLGDDAMISMRYARNLASGFGLVWNSSDERVEGYTNFLWTIYMAFVHLFPLPSSKTSLVILLTNIILSIGTIPIIIHIIRILNGNLLVIVATLVCYVLNKNIMVWTTTGFETTLLTFLLLLSIFRIINEAQQGRSNPLTSVLIAVISLVRADAIFLSVLLYALSILWNKNRRSVVVYSALSLTLPIAHEIFRVSYYGDVLPNTAYLKTFGWENRHIAGWQYTLEFVQRYPIVMSFALVGSLLSQQKQRSRIYLIAFVLAYMAYIVYVGGDAFLNFRFFVPVIPLLLVLAFLSVQSLDFTRLTDYLQVSFKHQFVKKATCFALLISGFIIIVLSLAADFISVGARSGFGVKQFFGIVVGFSLLIGSLTISLWWKVLKNALQVTKIKLAFCIALCLTTPLIVPFYGKFLEPSEADLGNVRIGLLLKRNTPLASRVADFWAGSVFYFSERYAIDLLGKSDRHIAHLPVTSDGMKPGHNKFDFDYSLGKLKPDFVVANFRLPVEEGKMLRSARGDWAFTGQLYFNRIFRQRCFPNPIPVRTWRTIFVCDWSSQIEYRDRWQELTP